MFRKLSLALAVSAALSSTGAFALGLGEISTKSALNENFKADIELVSVGPGELDGIVVTLASSADFVRKGLDRPFMLSKLRFDTVELGGGRAIVRVTTNDAVREPFLNFLVEVNWPKGRMLREFTVLLDPPVTAQRNPPRAMQVVSAPAEAVGSAEVGGERFPQQGRYVPVPAVGVDYQVTTAGQYGPVPRGMTLWRIAEEMAIPGASTEQVVMALFRSNPGIFAGNNINNLPAGAVLRIPDQETVLSQSRNQAKAEIRKQARGWTGPQGLATAPADRLAITATSAADTPGTDTDIERVKTDLMLVRESGESTRQETEDLRSRIRELESQLADIRQLLKLKSDQLAALQAGQTLPEESAEAIAALEAQSPAEAGLPQPEEVATQIAAGLEEPVPTAEEPAELAMETPVEPGPLEAEAPAPQAEPEEQPAQPPEEVAPQPQALPVALEPEPADGMLSDPMLLGGAAAGVVGLLGLVWFMLRRRRETEDQFDESVLLAPNESTTVEIDKESELAESVSHDEGTSFISDFSPSDIDALQEETGEVDPAAEADVYIAYGRYQQAESLINQAVEKAPDRLDLKLKLMEIYFTTRNVAAFTTLAEQLKSVGAPEKDPQMWARVQSMGRDLVPGHELFGTAEPSDRGSAPESTMGGADEMLVTDSEALAGMDLDLDTELSELQDEATAQAPRFGGGAVLEPRMPGPEVVVETPAPRGVEEDSEFAIDLSDLDTLEDIDLGDLGMDSEEIGAVQPPPTIATEPAEVGTPVAAEPAGVSESELVMEESEFELSQFDLEGAGASELDSTEHLSDILEGSEEPEEDTGTKLDLARAYLEMGDTEGAGEFLEEVLEEGNEEQKAEAKELMAKIT